MNAFFAPGARCTRLLVAFALVLMVAAPAVIIRAGKIQPIETDDSLSRMEEAMLREESRWVAAQVLPPGHLPPPEFSPFGGAFTPRRLQGAEAEGTLATPIGDLTWDPAGDPVNPGLKPGLRWGANEMTGGDKGPARPGLNYVGLSPAGRADLDAAIASLGEVGTIVTVGPRSTFLVNVDARNLHLLRRNPYVARIRALEPEMKIAFDFGARPRIRRSEADNPDLSAWVTLVPGVATPEGARALAALPGIRDVTEMPFGGQLHLRVRYDSIGRLARDDRVLSIATDMDYMLLNSESVPTIQAGSAEDANFIRPFDVAGVDGGGLNAIGQPNGVRVNNGTAQVPPQIVLVIDNGLSLDTPNFAQTATQPSIVTNPIGSSHRKVHAIQNAGDAGTTCDGPLSGSGTHGNVVSAAIAAYPSQLGFFLTRSGIGGGTEPRNENLDGIARGARIIMADAASTDVCNLNELVETGGNVSPGSLINRLNLAICPISGGVGACTSLVGGGAENHLAVLPFGAPTNFSIPPPDMIFPQGNGTYPQAAADLDIFLYNNRDYMIFVPVGNNGSIVIGGPLGLNDKIIPDLFNGTTIDEVDEDGNPLPPKSIQIYSPATAKNIVAVGAGNGDCFTRFGIGSDCNSGHPAFTARGPATPESLRMAPIVNSVAFDLTGTPYTSAVTVFRSNDNDNLAPIDAQIDAGNYGSSYAAAYMTGAGAIIRDYFAQGFYPTGDRVAANRTPNVSGALVKAALAASADFDEMIGGTQGEDANEKNLRRTRAYDVGTVSGVGNPAPPPVVVGIMGNSEQGYGRAVLTQVLPLSNWNDNFRLHVPSGLPRENPAAGLLAFDRIATGEPLIDNTTQTSKSHIFRVASSSVITKAAGAPDAGAVAVAAAQLRIALAWPDIPSGANTGGPLVNDLDLIVESPGPDGCLGDGDPLDRTPGGAACPVGSGADNQFMDGNSYGSGVSILVDQWSIVRGAAGEKHDFRNPIEAVHLTGDPNADFLFDDSRLYVGRWRVTVRRGWGSDGAPENPITIIVPTVVQDADQNEDDNGNGRLDTGEDNNGNGLLDQPGQPYSLVVSGPVYLAEAAPPAGPAQYPATQMTWTANRYSCADNATLNLLDTTGTATPANVKGAVSFQVLDPNGSVVDQEDSFNFAAGTTPFQFVSAAVPVRLAPGGNFNGILEGDTDDTLVATYNRAPQAPVVARALIRCSPDLVPAQFAVNGTGLGDQTAINNGCDNDENLDAGEVVTYGISIRNRSRTDSYADVNATLTPSGPGAAAIKVIDSPKNIGTLAGNGVTAIFFHVSVDPTTANALPVASRLVTMTLNLDSLSRGQRIARQAYSFTNAINSDRETFFYSTDFPAGGRQARDLNRNLEIDPADTNDPLMNLLLPREDVTFASLFSGSGAPAGHYTNEMGEDLDLSGKVCVGGANNGLACVLPADCPGGTCASFNGPERDILPNGVLDRGVLVSTNPLDTHRIPWNFDRNNGGWVPFRHASSIIGNIDPRPVWEYRTSGICGFQTSFGSTFGVWHTGDGDPATPVPGATQCENGAQPRNPVTVERAELLLDVLESPIISKVNQVPDARGFPFTVEFQRFGMNETLQLNDAYMGGGVNIDNDVDSDVTNSLLGQIVDVYQLRHSGGWPYGVFLDARQYWGRDTGVDQYSIAPEQRTFGPFVDAGVIGVIDAGDSGFSGNSQLSNLDQPTNPIPTAPPDYLPYPPPGVPNIGVCDGGNNNDKTCAPANPADPCVTGGGVCFAATNDVQGPVRNLDSTLIGYEGGFASILDHEGSFDDYSTPPAAISFIPGKAANRWQIGLAYWAIESVAGTTDFGKSVDDVVFEWKEHHPRDEAEMGNPPACSRFNGPGLPQFGQCATITADRAALFECDESIEVTVYDAKCNTGPNIGQPCATNATCGGGNCTADDPSVVVKVVTESDSIPVAYNELQVFYPNAKTYTLLAVPGTPGLFKGTITFSTTTNDPNHTFTVPGSDSTFTVYYEDPACDGDRDGQGNEDDFANVDGDGVPDATDKCPQVFDPGQADADNDGFGDLCDNCPSRANADQSDLNVDGVGDVCEFDDVDGTVEFAGDGTPDDADNCPDVRNPEQADMDEDGKGDLCDTQRESFGNANGRIAHSFFSTGACTAGTCDYPAPAAGRACQTDLDCVNSCDTTGTHTCRTEGLCVGFCSGNQNTACETNADCAVGGFCGFGSCSFSGNVCNANSDCGAGQTCQGGGANGATGLACQGVSQCLLSSDCQFRWTAPVGKTGQACTTNAHCNLDRDRDGDGVVDAFDNCVLTPNPNQLNSDGDLRGNACDPDCQGRVSLRRCTSNASLTADCTTNGAFYTTNRTWTFENGGGFCSPEDDDNDVDGVGDYYDNCPTVANPPIIAGTNRQRDGDHDGLGDACDPTGSFDDEQNGIPDDIPTFSGTISCRDLPLASLTVMSAQCQDIDGDIDAFPDTGETARLKLTLRNDGPSLTGATIVLTSSDPDVACITSPSVVVGTIPSGQTVVVGNFTPGTAGLQFVVSNSVNFQGTGDIAPVLNMCITVVANETLGVEAPICFNHPADLNGLLPTLQVFTKGHDGLAGTADDGIMVENFDEDRNGDGVLTVTDTFLDAIAPGVWRGYCSTAPTTPCQADTDCPAGSGGGPGLCYLSSYLRGTDAVTPPPGTFGGVACGGYLVPPQYAYCVLDPDFPMDWHFHCPPGATNCPNNEGGRTCTANANETACSFDTPDDGQMALSPPNSLHMGMHSHPQQRLLGDGQHFRTVQGFMSTPMNLALFARDGDLEMSMWHISRMMDNNGVGGGRNELQCSDCNDVQVQVDLNPDPAVDQWGFWDKLVPFQNVYDKKGSAWSAFAPVYCLFTPTDTGNEPPNPRGVRETMCFPQGLWSRCGSTTGTAPDVVGDCTVAGQVDPEGRGVWVETRFNLGALIGQRIRIRWMGNVWNFFDGENTYFDAGPPWSTTTANDGWWLDDITISGVVTEQATPVADTAPRVGTCPTDVCNEAVPGSDAGTHVVLQITDLDDNVLDGVNAIPFAGQSIRVSAINSTLPGGCVGGVPEYEFKRNGAVVQVFGTKTFFLDTPESNTSYQVRMRCSRDFTCTSVAGASIDVGPYSGDGGNAFFGQRTSPPFTDNGVVYFRGICTAGTVGARCNQALDCGVGGACDLNAADVTRLRWWGPGNLGTDVLRGTIPGSPASKGTLAAPFWNLAGLAANCFLSNIAGTPTTPGSNYTSGDLSLAIDPNPVGACIAPSTNVGAPCSSHTQCTGASPFCNSAGVYYEISSNSPGGTNVNAFGCANPQICNNAGWCELGSNAGAPCNVDADCAGGGTCALRTSFCAQDSGVGLLAGCARAKVCAGGANAGRLCALDAHCPGSACQKLGTCSSALTTPPNAPCDRASECLVGGVPTGSCSADSLTTAGQICYSVEGQPLPAPFGSCPPAGNLKRLVKRVGTGLVCP